MSRLVTGSQVSPNGLSSLVNGPPVLGFTDCLTTVHALTGHVQPCFMGSLAFNALNCFFDLYLGDQGVVFTRSLQPCLLYQSRPILGAFPGYLQCQTYWSCESPDGASPIEETKWV